MTWTTIFLNDSCESTLDTRTLQSEMSSSLIRSLIAYRIRFSDEGKRDIKVLLTR